MRDAADVEAVCREGTGTGREERVNLNLPSPDLG